MADLHQLKMNLLEKGGYEAVPTDIDEPVKAQAIPKKTKQSSSSCRSCCGRCLLVTLAVVVGFYLLAFAMAFVWMRHQVLRFTVPARHYPQPPIALQEAAAEEDDKYHLEMIADEAKLFWDTLAAGEIPEHDLILEETALNSLVAQSDYFRGHAKITLTDHQALVEYALPTDGLPGGYHRYFMGQVAIETQENSGHFAVQMTPETAVHGLNFDTLVNAEFWARVVRSGQPTLTVESGQFLNWVLPVGQTSNANFLECHDNCPHHKHHRDAEEDCHHFMQALAGIESVTIQEGEIVIQPRRDPSHRELVAEEETTSETPMAMKLARRVLRAVF